MITERLIIVVVILACIALLPLALRAYAGVSRRKAKSAVDRLTLDPQRPTVLYFWSEDCHQCHTAQKPTLNRLANEASVHVVSIDAVADRGLADRFGVLTVPTTIVMTPGGEVRAVNHGFAPLPKLRAQIA